MATIVQSQRNGEKYILLGAGYGAFKSSVPGAFFGNLSPDEHEGQFDMVAISDPEGTIHWVESQELTVVEVDGVTPSQILS